MSTLQDLFKANPVRAYLRKRRSTGKLQWIVPDCPFCRGVHIHGAGNSEEEAKRYLGSRVPHCATKDRPDMYFLLPAGLVPQEAIPNRIHTLRVGWLGVLEELEAVLFDLIGRDTANRAGYEGRLKKTKAQIKELREVTAPRCTAIGRNGLPCRRWAVNEEEGLCLQHLYARQRGKEIKTYA